ncbi:MAG: SGNH/GDSL hydrolase family protein [bacterium]
MRETLPAHLETALVERTGRKLEVLNFGVPGYNLDEEVDQYRFFAHRWNPDVVLLFLVRGPGVLDPPLCEWTRRRALGWAVTNVYVARVVYFRFIFRKMSSDYRKKVDSKKRLRHDLQQLAEVCRRNGARLGVVIFRDPLPGPAQGTGDIEKIMEDIGISWLDGRRWMEKKETEGLLQRLPKDGHFTGDSYWRMATFAADWLIRDCELMSTAGVSCNLTSE